MTDSLLTGKTGGHRGMKAKLLTYLFLMNASALQAGATAAKVFLGLLIGHSATALVPPANLASVATVFGISFLYEVLAWLSTHPLSQALLQPAEPRPSRIPPSLPPVAAPATNPAPDLSAAPSAAVSAPAAVPANQTPAAGACGRPAGFGQLPALPSRQPLAPLDL